ncbi:MAG: hypothetical protein AAFY03_11390, partial [Pseudomonadota bacterium]
MRILYVTANVLGDAGANAAEIFPRLAVTDPAIRYTCVADYEQQKQFVLERQKAEFLKLRQSRFALRQAYLTAKRVAKRAVDLRIDVIHVFYRQQNVPLAILLRMALVLVGSRAKVIMDHRSVNLARGRR